MVGQLPQDGVGASVAKLDGVGSGVWVPEGLPWGSLWCSRAGVGCNEDGYLEPRDHEQVLHFVRV